MQVATRPTSTWESVHHLTTTMVATNGYCRQLLVTTCQSGGTIHHQQTDPEVSMNRCIEGYPQPQTQRYIEGDRVKLPSVIVKSCLMHPSLGASKHDACKHQGSCITPRRCDNPPERRPTALVSKGSCVNLPAHHTSRHFLAMCWC